MTLNPAFHDQTNYLHNDECQVRDNRLLVQESETRIEKNREGAAMDSKDHPRGAELGDCAQTFRSVVNDFIEEIAQAVADMRALAEEQEIWLQRQSTTRIDGDWRLRGTTDGNAPRGLTIPNAI